MGQLKNLSTTVRLTVANPSSENKSAFGPGIAKLCLGVREMGSLNAAAKGMRMAYSKAWRIIKDTEETLDVQLLLRHRGAPLSRGRSSLQGDDPLDGLDLYGKRTPPGLKPLGAHAQTPARNAHLLGGGGGRTAFAASAGSTLPFPSIYGPGHCLRRAGRLESRIAAETVQAPEARIHVIEQGALANWADFHRCLLLLVSFLTAPLPPDVSGAL